MPARLPDFLGIGTQKGGTTSLHQWLSQHPQVYLPKHKEVHYFDLNSDKSINWYKNQFKESNLNEKCGEITPYYLFHPEVANRIRSTIPKIRMIALLRDPVERTLSQIFHSRKRGFEELELNEALAAEESRLQSGCQNSLQKHSYVSRSRYLEQLDRYENLFPKNQLLILKSEQLFENPKTIWEKIANFLNIETGAIATEFPRINTGRNELDSVPNELRSELRRELKDTALGIRERYGFGWDWA